MASPAPGTTIAGRYVVVGRLGEGGMGEVLRARDAKLDREVAVKLLAAKAIGDDRARARLVREARAAAKLAHPGIVHVYDVGETDDGGAFLVMELVTGETLRDSVAQGRAGLSDCLRVIVECARALAFAHRAGAVHRDVKPDNVMIREDGRAALLDFGIAKSIAPNVPVLTDEGFVLGTPGYLAPEQARGEEIDGRADQFALAVTAYEVLTGKLPWKGQSVAAVIAEILRDDPPLPSAVAPALPRMLDTVILRAMQKRPADRYADMDGFADAVQDVAATLGSPLSGIPRATPVSLAQTEAMRSAPTMKSVRPPAPPPPPRRARRAWLAAVLVPLVAVGAWAVWKPGERETPPPAASASASAPPAASAVPTAVTDLELPRSTSLDALAAYREGMQATRDGNVAAMLRSFKRASELDPTMAAALWRYADIAYANGDIAGAQQALSHALLQRASMTARDLAMAESYDPVLRRSPPDVLEYERRRAALAAQYPLDAEVQLNHGWAAFLAERYDDAERHARRALELDPKYMFAWLCVAWAFEQRGNLDESERILSLCGRSSSFCRADLGYRLGAQGKCGELDAAVAQLLTEQPDSSQDLLLRAAMLARQGASNETLRAALRVAGNAVPGPRGTIIADDVYDLWVGDFADLVARRPAREAAYKTDNDLGTQSRVALRVVTALRESGRDADAAAYAKTFLDRRPLLATGLWSEGPGGEDSGSILTAAGLARAERSRMRKEWFDGWSKAVLSKNDRYTAWLKLYASPATREDAEEALAAMPPNMRADTDGAIAPALANLYAAAGRWDDAIPLLERATHACDVLVDVPRLVRAHLELGDAYAAKANVPRACEEYAWVVARWGGAKPRSVSAEAAARRAKELRCGK